MSQPFAPLLERFHRISARAMRGDATQEIVLEALAFLAGLSVFRGLSGLEAAERRGLARKGKRTVLAAGPGRKRGEEAEDRRALVELAKAGLAALDGKTGRELVGPADPIHPPDGRLAAATRGELDGFALASAALHVTRCAACQRRLAVLRMAEEASAEPLRVAAASAVAMQRPDAGRSIETLAEPAAEIVLFEEEDERHLAVYAEASVPVRLVGDGLETLEMLAGYWLGRLAPGTKLVEAVLHVGEEVVDVHLSL